MKLILLYALILITMLTGRGFSQKNYSEELLAVSLPVETRDIRSIVSSSFGYRKHPIKRVVHFHNGIDLRVRYAKVYSVLLGKVKKTGYDNRSGKYVVVEHLNGIETSYCHLANILVYPGQIIGAGTVVGVSGNSGSSTGPHLHFVLKVDGRAIDPLRFLLEVEKRLKVIEALK